MQKIQGAPKIIFGAGVFVAIAGTAMGQASKPPLQTVESGMRVEPLRIATATIEHGQVVRTGDWQDYGTPRASPPGEDERVFDCYGDHNFDGVPDDSGGCSLSGSRWFFGTSYCNGFYSNDMTLAEDTVLTAGAWRADAAWYWSGDGSQEIEQCVLAIITEDSDAHNCEADSFEYPAWLIDFGDLKTDPGFYYYGLMDISLQGRWQLPLSGRGSYGVFFLTDGGRKMASCAQPMLWGSPNSSGGDPDGPGKQYSMQLDDDNPRDLFHNTTGTTSEIECYDYTFGICPDPLGGMLQFWGTNANSRCRYADFNSDGQVNTTDFTAFLNAWNGCDFGADCDRDGKCATKDLVCFLNMWSTCR